MWVVKCKVLTTECTELTEGDRGCEAFLPCFRGFRGKNFKKGLVVSVSSVVGFFNHRDHRGRRAIWEF